VVRGNELAIGQFGHRRVHMFGDRVEKRTGERHPVRAKSAHAELVPNNKDW
jgi:hypothetical protein